MKLFDLKSVAAGIIIGTFGITTAFAAAGHSVRRSEQREGDA